MSSQTSLTGALGEIDRASDIVAFSIVVVTRDKKLRNVDHSVFQQKAAVELQSIPAEFRGKHPRRTIVGLRHDMQCVEPKGRRSGRTGRLRENSFSCVAT
ncbi:hypothetical protein [Bradyrhizobium sp. Arg816]|uniref:hypothetical protein n=1 Tax=Bradyrhizobium sp. Arg816 TaxID=2998491 RepID=UPI00249E6507|nr:hypothetical protein [Bradyrhizobium sp. Arg816]MDI3565576.1 hypothetical protein [Bradyrhizobium sp. Arg816]